jgi:ankyrin repeat protein
MKKSIMIWGILIVAVILSGCSNATDDLIKAAKTGDQIKAALALKKGADVNGTEKCKMTSLHYAAQNNDLPVMKLLLSEGANVNAGDCNKRTPLHYAATAGAEDAARLLITNKADITAASKFNKTILHAAAEGGVQWLAEKVLESGADVNGKETSNGYTALHYAVKNGKVNIAALLVMKGATVDMPDRLKRTPLLIAAANGREDCVTLLLGKGASPAVRDAHNYTMLHASAEGGMLQGIDRALKNGLSVNAQENMFGMYPLHLAVREGHDKAVSLLLQKGALYNSIDNNKRTPLHYTAIFGPQKSGRLHCAELLLQKGTDQLKKDKDSKTPLMLAEESGKEELVKFLKGKETVE